MMEFVNFQDYPIYEMDNKTIIFETTSQWLNPWKESPDPELRGIRRHLRCRQLGHVHRGGRLFWRTEKPWDFGHGKMVETKGKPWENNGKTMDLSRKTHRTC